MPQLRTQGARVPRQPDQEKGFPQCQLHQLQYSRPRLSEHQRSNSCPSTQHQSLLRPRHQGPKTPGVRQVVSSQDRSTWLQTAIQEDSSHQGQLAVQDPCACRAGSIARRQKLQLCRPRLIRLGPREPEVLRGATKGTPRPRQPQLQNCREPGSRRQAVQELPQKVQTRQPPGFSGRIRSGT